MDTKPFLIINFILMTLLTSVTVASDINSSPLTAQIIMATPIQQVGQSVEIIFKLNMPEGYHAYVDKLSIKILEPVELIMTTPNVQPQKDWYDKFTKKSRLVFEGSSTASAVVELSRELSSMPEKVRAEIKYQACTDQFCLLPKKIIAEGQWPQKEFPTTSTLNQKYDVQEAKDVIAEGSIQNPFSQKDSLLSTFIGVFVAGILTSLTPCIFPMIPITLSILSNGSEKRSSKANFARSWIYVFGIAITYSILGVTAALSGRLFGASLSSPPVVYTLSALMFLMALSMMGLFEIQLPSFLTPKIKSQNNSDLGVVGIFTTGLAAGVVASPCVGPVLVSVLTFISSTQNAVLGFFLMMTYAIGMSLLLVALGSFNQMTRFIPRSGSWMQYFKMLLGFIMFGMSLYYLKPLVSDRVWIAALGLGLISFGVFERFFHQHTSLKMRFRQLYFRTLLGLGLSFVILPTALEVAGFQPLYQSKSAAEMTQKVDWSPLTVKALEQAQLTGKKVIIDFRADWCAACLEMDELTFTSDLISPFKNEFIWLRFDATEESEELEMWRARFKIVGLPTMVFIKSDGASDSELQLTAFEKPEKFIERLKTFQSR